MEKLRYERPYLEVDDMDAEGIITASLELSNTGGGDDGDYLD